MVVATTLVLALCALPSWNIPVLKEQRRDGVANRNSNKSSTLASKKQALAARESHALSSIEAFDAAVSRNTAILYGNITNSSPIRAASSPRLTMQLSPVIDSRGGPPKRIDKFVQSVDRNMAYYGVAHGMHKMPTHSYHRSGYRLASQKSSPIPVDSFVGHLNSNIRKAQDDALDAIERAEEASFKPKSMQASSNSTRFRVTRRKRAAPPWYQNPMPWWYPAKEMPPGPPAWMLKYPAFKTPPKGVLPVYTPFHGGVV